MSTPTSPLVPDDSESLGNDRPGDPGLPLDPSSNQRGPDGGAPLGGLDSADSGTAAGRAQQTASTAADESKHVAGVAAGEAKGVAGEAAQQAKGVVNDAVGQVRGQLDDQGRQQKDKLAGTLSTFGDDLGQMSENGSGLAGDLAREVSDRARSLAQHLESREPTELLDDVRRFARQRPGTFLLGALAAGVVAGRLLRGTKDAVEAAEAAEAADTPRATPGAPNTADVHASHGQPTQPPTVPTPSPVGAQEPTYATPPSATGYSSPPPGTGLPPAPDTPGGV